MPARGPTPGALAGEVLHALDARFLQRDEVERRVVHREQRADVAVLLALGPVALAFPGLQRDAHGRHAEVDLARVGEDDVLVRALRLLRADVGADLLVHQARPDLAVDEVRAADRGGAEGQVLGPAGVRLGVRGGCKCDRTSRRAAARVRIKCVRVIASSSRSSRESCCVPGLVTPPARLCGARQLLNAYRTAI